MRKFILITIIVVLSSFYSYSQEWEIDAENGNTISTCSGNVFDSNKGSGTGYLDGYYSNNEDYEMTVCSSTPGDQVRIDFYFKTELNYDYLDVYDGTSTSDPYLGRIWGDYQAGSVDESKSAISNNSGGCLHLVWHSDVSTVDYGYIGYINCVPTGSGTPTVQDCLGAIPICGDYYSTTASYTDAGSYPNEINPLQSCLSVGEQNDVWYVFTAQQTTDITFILDPNSSDDYDWAMYDLTNSSCEDIFYDPSLEISCNYAIGSGDNTGASTSGIYTHQDGDGTQWNAPIPVVTGGTYLINVSNFSSSQDGYSIDFSASSGAMVDNTPPALDQITSSPACGEDEITFLFSERVLCSSVDASDFNISGPGGSYTVTNINCNSGASYSEEFTITISPALTAGGTYDLNLTGQVDDACGNTVDGNSLSFSVSGVIASASVTANVTCNGGSDGTAVASGSGGSSPYTYNWSGGTPSGTPSGTSVTGLSATTYTVTVTDALGVCNDVQTVTLTEPGAISISFNTTDVQCNGGSDGTATAIPSGGNGATWTYNWSAGGATSSATNTSLSAGSTYIVTVYDNQNCPQTATISVSEPTALTIDGILQQEPSCNGYSDGQLSIDNPQGGTPNYTYNWNAGGTTSSQTNINLISGTYSVTITDDHGCTLVQNSINLDEPDALSNINTVTDATCDGNNNGSIATNVTGGTGSYYYTWDASTGGQTGTTATNLIAGDYDITITDDNSCELINLNITVNDDDPIVITVSSTTDATCGQTNGSATVSATGGSGTGYIYAWQGGQTGATISNVAAGAYDVTVTDSHGCDEVLSVNINNAAAPTISEISSSHIDVLCNGDNTGSAEVTASGGTGTLTYSWSNGTGGTTASNLIEGTYTASVTDANGCVSTTNITITEPSELNVIITSSTDASCNGYNDGSATASSSGGPVGTSYTYNWDANTGNQTGATATNLLANNYSVTVMDDNGCTDITSVTIHEPSAVSITATNFTNPLCFGDANGTATVTSVTGGTSGTGNYSYSWDTSPVQTGQTATGLTAGVYNVTVTDDNSCEATTSISLSQPTLLQVSTSFTDALCNSDNSGTATAIGSGGTISGNYSYSWDINTGNQTTATATGLSAGSYDITITDDNSCTATTSVTIGEPNALNSNITFSNVNCYGESNAYAIVTASDGTPGYTYLWDGGQTTDSIGGLIIGTYYVTITDNHSCTKIDSVLISQPAVLDITSTSVDVSCHGYNDGQANITITGGTTPYIHLWSNSETTQNITDYSGTYTVTVTDNHGCSETETVTINEPDTISVTVTINNPNCGNTDGDALVTPSGGYGTYSYLWSSNAGGNTTNSVTNLGAGSYIVSITDDNSCLFVQNVDLSDLGSATINVINVNNNQCYNDSLGSAETQIVSGGTAPFNYTWMLSGDTIQSGTDNTVDSIPAGTYSIVVEDNNGCISTDGFVINENPEITSNMNIVQLISCFADTNGIISVSPAGGTAPYSYSWSHDNTLTDSIASNIGDGTYYVTITDDSLCTSVNQITLSQPQALSVSLDTFTNVSCYEGNNGTITVQPGGGTPTYNYLWDNGDNSSFTDSLIAGYHTVTITDNNNCLITDSFEITQASQIMVSISTVNSICGGATGSLTINANGGTSPYSYEWEHDTLLTSNTANNLSQGDYNMSVIDSLGCTLDTMGTVVDDGAGTASISSVNDVLCNGESTGTATIAITGGTADFTYVISMAGINIDSTQSSNSSYDISNLVHGTYNVDVYDVNGCLSTTTFTINQPTELKIADSTINVDCYNGSTGAIFITTYGGTPSYLYNWDIVGNDSAQTDLSAGFYSVTVVDVNACEKHLDSIQITQPTEIVITLDNAINLSCNNDSTGSITVSATGGTPDYTYAWNNGQTGDNLTGLNAGSYIVTITDKNLCNDTMSVMLTQPNAMLITDSVYYENHYGAISVSAVGGTPDYTYEWSNGETNNVINGLFSGDYWLTITDANGCAFTNLYNVEIDLVIPSVITPNNDGKNDFFRITNINAFEQVDIKIFNRWGDIIFDYSGTGIGYEDQEKQWDGFYNGKELPMGSYVYIVDLKNDKDPYTGTVTIVR